MSKNKPKAYIWFEDGQLCYRLENRRRGESFGFDLIEKNGAPWLSNFQYATPVPSTLKELLVVIEEHRGVDRRGNLLCRVPVSKIKVKADMEARYQSILQRLGFSGIISRCNTSTETSPN